MTTSITSRPPACVGRLWHHIHAERSFPTHIRTGSSVSAFTEKKKLSPDPFSWLSYGVKPRRNKHSSAYEETFDLPGTVCSSLKVYDKETDAQLDI